MIGGGACEHALYGWLNYCALFILSVARFRSSPIFEMQMNFYINLTSGRLCEHWRKGAPV